MEEENQKFDVQIETGEIVQAELLSIVDIDGKEYAIYSLENENGTVDILSSYVEQDEEGYDILVDIDNPYDKQKVSSFIQNLMN
jgi:hypothetical protein